jgi:hypothetical protein
MDGFHPYRRSDRQRSTLAEPGSNQAHRYRPEQYGPSHGYQRHQRKVLQHRALQSASKLGLELDQ